MYTLTCIFFRKESLVCRMLTLDILMIIGRSEIKLRQNDSLIPSISFKTEQWLIITD